jgi:Tfp pilus assembly protein PilO
MDFLKRHLVFSILMGCFALALLTLGWFLYSSGSKASKAEAEVLQRQAQLQRFFTMPIYPNRDNASAVSRELDNAREALDAMFKLLQSSDQVAEAFPPPPANRTEAFFALTRFVEELRQRIEETGISIRPEERFSFTRFTYEAPDADTIPRVFRQRYLAEIILNSLVKASPTAIVSFQRESVSGGADAGQPAGAAGGRVGDGGPDTFVIPPEITARREGFIATEPFQVRFQGYTNSLRLFLNDLANSPFPIVVRSVSVEPVVAQANKPSEPVRRAVAPPARRPGSPFGTPSTPFGSQAEDFLPPENQRPVQIIGQNLSLFTVVLEYIELIKPETANPL